LVVVLLENVRLACFGHVRDAVGQRFALTVQRFALTGSILPSQSIALP
jgi:hypothetical protein